MVSEQELEEMRADYEERDRVITEAIETIRQIRSGEIITIPANIDHARAMFKMACFYLSQHDEEFELELDWPTPTIN